MIFLKFTISVGAAIVFTRPGFQKAQQRHCFLSLTTFCLGVCISFISLTIPSSFSSYCFCLLSSWSSSVSPFSHFHFQCLHFFSRHGPSLFIEVKPVFKFLLWWEHASLTVECKNVTNSATGPLYTLIICRKYWSFRLNQCGMLQHGLPQLNELKPVRHAARNNASSIKHASAFPWHLPSVLQRSLCVRACVRSSSSGATFLNTPVHWTHCCSSNAIDLYLTGIWFESRQGYLLSWFSWLLVVLKGWRRLSSSHRLPSVRLRSLPGFQSPFTHGAV